jgi:xanthine dehydrogenase accessory factor
MRLKVDDDSYVVFVTRGHAYDKTVLAQALHTQAGYDRHESEASARLEATYRALIAEGFTAEQLAKGAFSYLG